MSYCLGPATALAYAEAGRGHCFAEATQCTAWTTDEGRGMSDYKVGICCERLGTDYGRKEWLETSFCLPERAVFVILRPDRG